MIRRKRLFVLVSCMLTTKRTSITQPMLVLWFFFFFFFSIYDGCDQSVVDIKKSILKTKTTTKLKHTTLGVNPLPATSSFWLTWRWQAHKIYNPHTHTHTHTHTPWPECWVIRKGGVGPNQHSQRALIPAALEGVFFLRLLETIPTSSSVCASHLLFSPPVCRSLSLFESWFHPQMKRIAFLLFLQKKATQE